MIKILHRMEWFLGLVLLQVLVLNQMHVAGYATPFFYIYFILKFNSRVGRNELMLWSFALGLTVDMFGNMTYQMMDVEIDEKTLSEIASRTGGQYFRATDKQKLKAIYDEINQMEKSKVEVTNLTIYHEQMLPLLLLALALLLLEFIFTHIILKRIP